MNFRYDKPACQNIRTALSAEWLETNGLGDYASSSLVCCNTRRYHGLLVAELPDCGGRHVLLSTMEESLLVAGHEFKFSCRRHPGVFFPRGHEYLQGVSVGLMPRFRYRVGDLTLTRELMLMPGKHLLIIKYMVESTGRQDPPMKLRAAPLLAFRNYHQLTRANLDLQVKTFPAESGFKIQPYNGLPPLFMQTSGTFEFFPAPDWYYNVEYVMEAERGFPDQEDLFRPGVFEIEIVPGTPVYLTASTESLSAPMQIEKDWKSEEHRRMGRISHGKSIDAHLARECGRFLVRRTSGNANVLAGYHWFESWSRDTMIALPGLAFCSGEAKFGMDILQQASARIINNGMLCNCEDANGTCSYNSADASLWFCWAVQQAAVYQPREKKHLLHNFGKAVCRIIESYSSGKIPNVTLDESGLLNVGNSTTQLTWMDAIVNGRPVTPRDGEPVEIEALWYNACAFADEICQFNGEQPMFGAEKLQKMKDTFIKRFWVEVPNDDDYLADCWRPTGLDKSVRPNMIFAASMPYSMLDEDQKNDIVSRCRSELLTPYGLRTLAPKNPAFIPHYEGNPEARDRAYHQGTVWPWLLGAYAEAVFLTTPEPEEDASELLEMLTPLYTTHLREAGIGSISEIFDANAPYQPRGCIAQAWSVAECLRVLKIMAKKAPVAYRNWKKTVEEA